MSQYIIDRSIFIFKEIVNTEVSQETSSLWGSNVILKKINTSLSNNRMGARSLENGTSQVRFKGWN